MQENESSARKQIIFDLQIALYIYDKEEKFFGEVNLNASRFIGRCWGKSGSREREKECSGHASSGLLSLRIYSISLPHSPLFLLEMIDLIQMVLLPLDDLRLDFRKACQ